MNVAGSTHISRYGQDGFTLLELLIAVSLLGLIFAALAGGLRFGTAAWRVGADRLADSEDLQLVHRTLRRQLASALNAPGQVVEPEQAGSFAGRRDRASFVGTAPARSMAPGMFQLTLGLKPDGQNHALSLIWRRIGLKPAGDDREDAEPLLRGVRSIRFSYFGNPDGVDAPRWVDDWKNTRILPRLVRIEIEFADRQRSSWPAIVLPVGARSD